jgi:hypothetical protein
MDFRISSVRGTTMTPSSDDQTLFRLSELPKYIPNGRTGRPRHVTTVYRYALRGVRGIRLRTVRLPDGLYTTFEAWNQFVRELTASDEPPLMPSECGSTRAKRHQAVEAEIRRLSRQIRKPSTRTGMHNRDDPK